MSHDLEFKIDQKFQNGEHDCGHTCLDMLGYAGHDMFPDKEGLSPKEVRTIPGFREKTLFKKGMSYYDAPHMWMIFALDKDPKNNLIHYTRHMVIRYQDKIHCPVAGTMNYQEYINAYFGFITHEFFVPINRIHIKLK